MLVPRRWWCSESGSSVYRAGCAVKDACDAAVTPRRRAASEAACVPRRANMRSRRRDSGRPSWRQSWRRQIVISKGSVIPTNPPSVFVSGSSQPHEQCFKSVDTQCLTVEGPAGSRSHGNTFVHAPQSAPAPALRPSTSHHHAPSSWLRRAWLATLVLVTAVAVLGTPAAANTPPRFVLDGQSEIVIRLTEGEATPVGTKIYTLKGYDPDGDALTFGVRGAEGRDLLRIEQNGSTEANVYLRKALDREIKDEYTVVLTLTDHKLGDGQFITQSMLLLVEDINDNEPIFRPYESSLLVDENAPQVLTKLLATDQDEGPFGQVIYRLEADTESDVEKFTISTVDGEGVLRLVGDLDYERKSLYQLRVLAVDRAISGQVNTATAALVVRVGDVEDQPPQFIHAPPVTRIPEDIPVNSGVLEVKAVDGDRGVNNRITYSILEGDKGLFHLDPNSGVLYVRKPLDRESPLSNNGAFIIKIQAEEASEVVSPPPTMVTEVTVLLEDVNDETPTFKAAHYVGEVAEGAQYNSPVNLLGDAIPEVYDHDQGNNGTFRMFLEDDGGMFEVTPPEGVNFASFLIRVRNPTLLDFEKVKVVNFTVVARETVAENPKSSSALVTVYIRDTNDNFPIFGEESYEMFIPEDAQVGTTVARIQARDPDSGNFGTDGIRYTDLRGSLADKLEMDPETGVIILKESGALDRESLAEHYLTAEARDDLGRGNRNTVVVKVVVQDVNDHPPVFLQPRYEARIHENAAAFPEPLVVSARDDDLNGTRNHEVRYVLMGGDPGRNFTVHPQTGRITPTAPLDFEAIPQEGDLRSFNLTVKAYDLGEPPLSSEAAVVVFVVDENDHAPQFDRPLYRKTIPEDTPPGTAVTQVFAEDLDGSAVNSKVVFRIQHGAQDKFVMDADTGVISVAQGAVLDPDRTEPRATTYVLEVVALDGGIGGTQLQARTVVNITILDVNNKPPVFVDPGTIRVSENVNSGHYVHRVEAVDLDAEPRLKYSLDPFNSEARNEEGSIVKPTEYNYMDAFEINEVDGVIRTAMSLDREQVEVIRIGLVCEDLEASTGKQTATATLTIIVEDTNDNDPQFRKPYYRRSVAENSKNGTTVVSVVADDIDKNRTIAYSLQGPRQVLSLMKLDSETGEVIVTGRVDRERFSWLNFTVQAVDSGVPPRSSNVQVVVQVIDENDNNPTFIDVPSNLTIREDAPPGTVVTTVTATDPDSDDYGLVTYLLDRKSSFGKFEIHPDTGVITVSSPLNREERSTFTLLIEAWDNYQFGYSTRESRNAFMQLGVTVADINDEVPVFEERKGCTVITEFHEARETITVVRATDGDDLDSPNGRIRFTIEGGNEKGLFEIRMIEQTAAEIFAAKPLVGQYGNYSLQIQAQDRGFPPNSIMSYIDICVLDFNDHAPEFVSPSENVTIKVPENATVGSLVIQVRATDKDIGINGAVRYRILKDGLGNWQTFTIDQTTGAILLQKPLDRERQKVYEIRVEAYDQGTPTPHSNDLDLTIYVRNVNDYEPQFVQDEVIMNFTEHKSPGAERFRLVDTVDLDDEDAENSAQVCYFIVGGDEYDTFSLDRLTHELMAIKELDREVEDHYTLLVKATEDCLTMPEPVPFFDPRDDTLLKVHVFVNDINDNPPRFTREVFTGGITTASDFGLEVMRLTAYDPDAGENSRLRYYMDGRVQETLSENLDTIRRSPFLVDPVTGIVKLNFDPQKGMKGYFDFKVYVNDTSGWGDRARVFIYLLREDQRVRFILRQSPDEVREQVEYFRDYLGNITGAIVNVDDFRVHENHDGTVDKTKTDLYLHLVDRSDNSVLEVKQVLAMIDKNVEHLDHLFKELNVLDTQRAELITAGAKEEDLLFLWLVGVIVFLTLLLVLTVALCLSQKARYSRRLKAATATAFGECSHDPGLTRSSAVPNTNIHSVEGSNPIWMSGFDNDWYKDEDSLRYQQFVHQSEGNDSLDDNAVDPHSLSPRGDRDMPYITQSNVPNPLSRESSTVGSNTQLMGHEQQNINDTYRANLYQTFHKIANPLVDKKLETTEL
ncbi:cadherin-23-like isoform X6 [Eriocheir sinensis]|uniref:cadherin-23-like isoform X6 n=1 Tax=Eriocheir sinensis TaxID=95602 RepID=UPI0021C79875|nr:cadherin-23-like isoform X6 [Eriocheir sinensis]